MLTVKKLKEFLSCCRDDAVVKLSNNEEIHHVWTGDEVILSPTAPIGLCKRCGENIYKEATLDYAGFCPNCDENLYSFEIIFKEKKNA